MSNFDNLMQGQKETTEQEKQKTEYAKKQASKRQAIVDMTEKATHDSVSTAENMRGFLTVMSHFEAMSINNNLLIFTQKPSATKLKEFDDWKNEGFNVKKGSKSLTIWKPSEYTRNGESHKVYALSQRFDISDIRDVESESVVKRDTKLLIRALVNEVPVDITTLSEGYPTNIASGAFYDAEKKQIFAKANMPMENIFPAVAMALAHYEMDRAAQKGKEEPVPYRTEDHEFQAKCVAYVLCKKYLVPTDKVEINSIPPKYATMESGSIRRDLDGIRTAAKEIEQRMELCLNPKDMEKEKTKNEHDREER